MKAPILAITLLLAGPAAGGDTPENEEAPAAPTGTAESERCARIENDDERLACYDALTAGSVQARNGTFVERHWDLLGETRLFEPWAHRPNYVLPARYSSNPNEEPFREAAAADATEPPDVQAIEAKFQISFKTKLLHDMAGGPGDLWFGYTQQSHFQVYNASESRPFRETNFEPEAIVTFPTRRSWGAWTWRMVGLGFVHQSNGRSEPLSRSWNRVYAVAAVERGNLSIHVRPWVRVDSTSDDDNPGITDFVGRLETVVLWSGGKQVLAVRGRSNLEADGHKGSLQADWFFPLRHRLRVQLQVFTGYGESLIDYDHRQTTVGAGVLLFDPF